MDVIINNKHLENYSIFKNNVFKLIDSVLISIDAFNLLFNNNSYTHELYYLLKFNNYFKFENLINIISAVLYSDVHYNISTPCKNYYILIFKNKDDILLLLHLYDMNIFTYFNKFTESYYDFNLIYRNYNGYNIMHNFHSTINITYDDILKRAYNKKFCYLSYDLNELDKLILSSDDTLVSKSISDIINKFTYAIKFIQNGWIMDEYILKNDSWTINYWKNYENFIDIIKFHNDCILDNKCSICIKKFVDTDIIFNQKNLFVHYNCLFNELFDIIG